MKLTADPVVCEPEYTFDLEVADGSNASNSYQIAPKEGEGAIVTHNTVSLLAGATPGVHFPISRCYIRRIRLSKDSDLVGALKSAGLTVEPAVGSEKSTVVVSFPIKLDPGIRSQDEVSMWEKLQLTKFMQEHWADNQVSVTIDFDKEKEGEQISAALDYFQYHLKSVSFLPRIGGGTPYPQMPYETISEEQCDAMMAEIRPISFPTRAQERDEIEDKVEKDIFCDGDQCVIVDNHREVNKQGELKPASEKRSMGEDDNAAKKRK